MIKFVKSYWKTLVFFAIVGVVGGFFTGIYLLDSYPADIKQQLVKWCILCQLSFDNLLNFDNILVQKAVHVAWTAFFDIKMIPK